MLHKRGRLPALLLLTPQRNLCERGLQERRERVVVLMRIPSDDGGLGVMGLDENKQSARVPVSQRCIPVPLNRERATGEEERVHLLQRALFLEATYLMRKKRGFAEE